MRTTREYGIEARIILKKLEDAGCKLVKTGCSYTSDGYYDISCEGLTLGEIAYNLWNLEDSLLHIINPDGKKAWARFIFGNGWGELVADYSVNLLGTGLPYEEARKREREVGIWGYYDWSINDVLKFFGTSVSFTSIIDEAMNINRGSPLIENEADSETGHTQEE